MNKVGYLIARIILLLIFSVLLVYFYYTANKLALDLTGVIFALISLTVSVIRDNKEKESGAKEKRNKNSISKAEKILTAVVIIMVTLLLLLVLTEKFFPLKINDIVVSSFVVMVGFTVVIEILHYKNSLK